MQTNERLPWWRRPARETLARLAKSLLVGGSETLLGLALVLFFALVSLGILMLSFPKGTGLVSLYDDLVQRRGEHSRFLLRERGDEAAIVAVLDRTLRQVRDRPVSALTWRPARQGMELEDQHTIQTLGHSMATIVFGDAGRLELGERSLVVVKQQAASAARRNRPAIVLLGGQVRGSLPRTAARSAELDIVTSGGTSAIRSGAEGDTEFAMALHPDQSSTLAVYSGSAEIETADGALQLGPNQAVTYDAAGRLAATVRIPDTPRPLAPADGQVVTFGAVAPRVEFRWGEAPEVDGYRLVVARDAEFSDVVYQGEQAGGGFEHGGLAPGTYHWRVSAVAQRAESRHSPARVLHLRQDLEPPALVVELPEEVEEQRLVVRGRVEPGCELLIENDPVPVDAGGRFEHPLSLERGLNMIVIEAVDEAGNVTYRSSYVTARY